MADITHPNEKPVYTTDHLEDGGKDEDHVGVNEDHVGLVLQILLHSIADAVLDARIS
jgi:hypothetical protein